MVINTTIGGVSVYLHAAFATDNKGADFNLNEFAGAVYVGNYRDQSATESTDWRDYTWQLIGESDIEADEIDSYEELPAAEFAEVEDSIDELDEATTEINARAYFNNDNLQRTQNDANQGIGNLNLLIGTNQGVSNWSATGATITALTASIYNDDNTVNAMHAATTAATASLHYDADGLNDFIENNAEINTFTLSYDMRVTNAAGAFSVASSGVLSFDAPAFDSDDPLEDYAGAWVHFISTAELSSGAPNLNYLAFDYSGSIGDEIDIANLKIEAGADATEWRASLSEVEATANNALTTATAADTKADNAIAAVSGVANYFWHDSSGAHVTQVTQTQYQGDPANSGGNTLITSSGLNVLDGITTLASFGSTGAQIGKSGETRTTITDKDFTIIDENDVTYFEVKDLRTNNGIATLKVSLVYDGVPTLYTPLKAYSVISVKANGVDTNFTFYPQMNLIQLDSPYPSTGDLITIVFETKDRRAKRVQSGYNPDDPDYEYRFIISDGVQGDDSNSFTIDWYNNVGIYGNTKIQGDVSVTGDVSGASASLTDTLTVGRDPTSNLEVATKQYIDANAWMPTFETIRNGISISTTSTNYGTNSISLSDFKFIELRLYNSSSMSSNVYPIETVKAQVGGVYINHGQVCRLGSTNVYLTWKYNDDTHLQMNINSGSNMYVGIFGIK